MTSARREVRLVHHNHHHLLSLPPFSLQPTGRGVSAVAGRPQVPVLLTFVHFLMAASKAPIPQVNLKDRIAALQQRNAESNQADHKHSSLAPSNPARTVGSLRDKIASFEKQGAVPVPRGSFGIGAPPVDDGSSRRRGEMIGNRVPGLSKPVAPAPTQTLKPVGADPSGDRKRCVSTSDLSSPIPFSLSTLSADGDGSSPDLFANGTQPRYPSISKAHTERRTVSDILHQLTAYNQVDEALPEGDEEAVAAAPVIVVSSEAEHTNVPESSVDDASQPVTEVDARNSISLNRGEHDEASQPRSVTEFTHHQTMVVSDVPAEAEVKMKPQPVSDNHTRPQLDVEELPSGDEPISAEILQLQLISVSDSVADVAQVVLSEPVSEPFNDATSALPDSTDLGVDDIKGDSSVEGDFVSVTDRTSASYSNLSTPSDHVVFPSSAGILSMKLECDTEPSDVSTFAQQQDSRQGAIVVPPPLKAAVSPATLRAAPVHIPQKAAEADEVEDLGDQSFALDTTEAVIVTQPARIVTPIVTTRAVLVPVPQGLSPTSSPSSETPVSAAPSYAEPSLTPKTKTGAFRAVVHSKISEGSTEIHSRSSSAQSYQSRLLPRMSVTVAEPQTPGFSDLADLMADAAMLEEQLSGLGSPLKNLQFQEDAAAPPTPEHVTIPSEPPASEVELLVQEPPSPIEEEAEIPDGQEVSEHESLQEFPSVSPEPQTQIQVKSPETPPPKEQPRSRILSDTPPPVPPKSPRPRYFSTLLSRKPSVNGMLSMPGSHQRNSVCSEVSEDDSVLVSTPPSPRFEYLGSDASSVRSSNQSWKLPKKSLSRATSFADRLWKKRSNRNTVVIASPGKQHLHVLSIDDGASETCALHARYADDDVHLSVGGVHPRQASTSALPKLNLSHSPRSFDHMSPADRPMSWVSVSSVGSSGLDSALFDAFPSVPTTIPEIPSLSTGSDSSDFLSPSRHVGSPGRSATLPIRSNHQKKRSSML